jgi:hypothetical protein
VGRDEREGNSPSWFNSMEVQQVMKYALALREVRRNPIAAADIGVITPHHKQVRLCECQHVSHTDAWQGIELRLGFRV